jgi:hypothetical protein
LLKSKGQRWRTAARLYKRKNARLKIQSGISGNINLYLMMCVFILKAVISRWWV